MKKFITFLITAFLLIGTIALVSSAATVVINPATPNNGEDITCSVLGNAGDFDFYWYKNGQEFRVDYGISSTILSSNTNPGDTWKCAVYTPMGNKVGEAEVKFPSYPAGSVIINPSQPEDDDSLTCSAPTITGTLDFTWYQNGVQFKTESGTESTVSASDTSAGDNWRCSASIASERIGDAVAIIDSDSNASVSISPEEAYTNDDLTASVSSSGDYNYIWEKNDENLKTETGATSEIDASDTAKYDTFKVTVYTPVYHTLVGEAEVSILNSMPVITDMNYPESINAGDPLTISFSAEDADNDELYYFMYMESNNRWVYVSGNSATFDTTGWDEGEHAFALHAADSDSIAYEYISVYVNGGVTPSSEIKIYNLDISALSAPGSNYLRIRNYAHSLDAMLRLTSMDTNEVQSFNLDISRNSVKLIPLTFNFEEGKQYIVKVDVISENFVGSDYMIVQP